jgi:HAD superfamily hydrolase (TIGR01549 family)
MIRAVIFDLGHTIWDIALGDDAVLDAAYSVMSDALASRLGRADVPAGREIRRAVTRALQADAETYFAAGTALEQPPTHHWVALGCREVGLELDETVLRELTPPLFATEVDRLVVAEGTCEAIRALAERGILLGAVTNTLADTPTIRLMLRRNGIEDVMGCVVVSSEAGYRKPHPSLFQEALRGLGVEAGEALFVGDSPYHDIGGATAVGMRAVLTTQYVERPWIEGVPEPFARITHLRELGHLVAI